MPPKYCGTPTVVSVTVFFTTKHNSITFGTYYVNDSIQAVYGTSYAAVGVGCGSQQREVADMPMGPM